MGTVCSFRCFMLSLRVVAVNKEQQTEKKQKGQARRTYDILFTFRIYLYLYDTGAPSWLIRPSCVVVWCIFPILLWSRKDQMICIYFVCFVSRSAFIDGLEAHWFVFPLSNYLWQLMVEHAFARCRTDSIVSQNIFTFTYTPRDNERKVKQSTCVHVL